MHRYLGILGLIFASTTASARPLPAFMSSDDPLTIFRRTNRVSDTFFDFSGQAKLPGCSGSVVSFGQADTARAVVLTNGHCIGMMYGEPNAVIVSKPYNSNIALYIDSDRTIPAKAVRILYGLIQPHDIAFLELDQTYAALAAQGVRSRKIAAAIAPVGTDIALASGYFNSVNTCRVEAIIHEIHESGWINTNSYKYHCRAQHGTSGSPLVDLVTGEVIGVNYTGNDDGEQCTFNNPCEVDEQGNISVEQGADYGDQIYKVMTCLNAAREIDLSATGCELPKP